MIKTQIHKARSNQDIIGKRRSCSLSQQLANRLNIEPLHHIRIDGEDRSMYCIVKETHEKNQYPLRMPKATRDRFKFEHEDTVRISPTVPQDSYMEARRTGGFAETVWDNEKQDNLLIMSLHGGDIEFGTDDVPIRLYKKFQRENVPVSAWMCHGFNRSFKSDAFTNWHISKPCKSIQSYPGLNQVATRRFDYTVSIHMQGKDDSREDTDENEYYIGVGGRIDDEVRFDVAERLRDRTDKTVVTDLDEMQFAGQHELNSANYLSKDGSSLQLELTPKTAYVHRKDVAKIVYNVFSDLV